MSPKEQHPELQAFHDGELPPAASSAVAAHLRGCPACRAELAELRSLDSLLKRKLIFSDISEAVLARVQAPEAAGSRGAWWELPAMVLAAVAVYALCVETGALPWRRAALLNAVAAQKEARSAAAILYGRTGGGKEEMLAMLLEGK